MTERENSLGAAARMLVSERALPPRPPTVHGSGAQTEARSTRLRGQLLLERLSTGRGLFWLALLTFLLSLLRAGWDRVFVPGWWRQW